MAEAKQNPQVPSVPYGYLDRQRLSVAFSVAMDRYPVVLVTAPNGYGKTAFLAHELAECNRSVAWVDIDARFAMPQVFATEFTTAIAQAAPQLVGALEQLAEAERGSTAEADTGETPDATATAGGKAGAYGAVNAFRDEDRQKWADFANLIAAKAPDICIVLDGYENIESDRVNAFVDFLMERLPGTARLVVAASRRPRLAINRMVMRGRLIELKTADFAFTFHEAASLFNGELGLDLAFGQTERINRHMDGWAAGLRMVEVALRSGMDMETALGASGELQRNISQYLADDIVNRQEPYVRDFLLQTSAFEAFCADLCDFALCRDDSARVIALLQERKLFVQQAGRPGWFRYANFFRACLRDLAASQLASDDEFALQRTRSSKWLAAHGMTERALAHAIEAGDYDQVQAVLGGTYGATMGQDEAARMNDLMQQLPESIVRKSRWANIGAAIACEMRQSFAQEGAYAEAVLSSIAPAATNTADAAQAWRESVHGIASDKAQDSSAGATASPGAQTGTASAFPSANASPGGTSLAASLHILRMLHDYHQGRAQDAADLGQALLDGDDDLGQHGRCGVLNVMGIAHWHLGNVAQARACWQESANLATYIDWPYSICLNLFGVAHAHYACGNFESAQETCERIFAIGSRQDPPVLSSGYAHMLMAKIRYDRNELDQAASQIRTARRIAYAGKEQVLAMNAEMALARVGLAQGNRREAVERANRCLTDFCSNLVYRQSFDEANMLMAQVWLLADKPDLAGDYLGRIAAFDASLPFDATRGRQVMATEVFGLDFRNVWSEEPLFDLLYARIQEGRTQGVDAWLDFVRSEAGSRGLALIVTKALIMKALCAYARSQADAALGWLAEALALGEPNGCVRTFADAREPMERLLQLAKRKQMGSRFGNQVLALVAQGRPVAASMQTDFGQDFTRREREIMGLLLQGTTNDEISKRLFLSLSTVKNHIHHIYTKLGVRNRAEAIVAMRELDPPQ